MEVDYKTRWEKAQLQIQDLSEDLKLAQAKLEGDPCTIGIHREMKIDRQRKALHILNRRVRIQRLQLGKLEQLERGLRPEEWIALKELHAVELSGDEDWDSFNYQ